MSDKTSTGLVATEQKVIERATKGGWFARRPKSGKDRLIIPFHQTRWVTVGHGFDDADREVPAALKERGVKCEEWTHFVEAIDRKAQKHQVPITAQVACWMTLLPLPLLLARVAKYQKQVGMCLDELNRDLEPHGMVAKFQTNCADGVRYHEENSWLAIALTPLECEKLRNEPVIWRPRLFSGFKSQTLVPYLSQKVFLFFGSNRSI